MAVTGFWPVFKNLKATLDYADNPDKTTAPEYLDKDLYAALRYGRKQNGAVRRRGALLSRRAKSAECVGTVRNERLYPVLFAGLANA